MKHPHDTTPYTLEHLEQLWDELGDNAYFNDSEELEQSWYQFPAGTDKHTIWHWFEEQHVDFSVAKIMGLV